MKWVGSGGSGNGFEAAAPCVLQCLQVLALPSTWLSRATMSLCWMQRPTRVACQVRSDCLAAKRLSGSALCCRCCLDGCLAL